MSRHANAEALAKLLVESAKAASGDNHAHPHHVGWALATFMQAAADDPNWARRVARALEMEHSFKLYTALRQEVDSLLEVSG